jgi:hypothetical protein
VSVSTLFVRLFSLAAQRAFMSWKSLFIPAAVTPPFFFTVFVAVVLPFLCAHRAVAAAAIFARVAGDIRRFLP